MDVLSDLVQLQTLILDQIAKAANYRDIAGIASWTEAAKGCDRLIQEVDILQTQIDAFKKSIQSRLENHSQLTAEFILEEENSTTVQQSENRLALKESGNFASPAKITQGRSPKAEGTQARSIWVQKLQQEKNIRLSGHGKRFDTARQQKVGIAYASEVEARLKKWFLGLPDEPVDIVVMLCRALDNSVYDFVIPVSELGDVWKHLTRSGGQMKFHIQLEHGEFLLSVPHDEPIVISKYKSNYSYLR